MTVHLLRRNEVQRITGLGRTRLDELEREGRFPARVRVSDRAVAWRSDELDEWLASRPRASDVRADRGGDVHARTRDGRAVA